MFKPRGKLFFITLFVLFFTQFSVAQNTVTGDDQKVLQDAIHILRHYFNENKDWHIQRPEIYSNIYGLIHFIEDAPIDTVLLNLDRAQKNDSVFVYRLPEDVEDSLSVPGYIAAAEVELAVQKIKRELQSQVQKNPYPVPKEVVESAKQEAQALIIPELL